MKIASISIIIPTYQHGATIASCLKSIFAQTLQPEEIIVINDGSTDETLEVLKPFRHKIILMNQENQGNQMARNRGFENALGEFVLFCDADISMRPDMLEKMYEKLKRHPEASYAYSGFRFGWKKFSSFPFDPVRLEHINYIHTTSLVRREHFPGFDVHIKKFQDWDIWLTMLSQGHIGVFIDDELFRIIDVKGRTGISKWLPKYAYKIPWRLFHWCPWRIKNYEEAREILFKKHKIRD
jgi:glycosyltransferase involved in cell wall biosynthesis